MGLTLRPRPVLLAFSRSRKRPVRRAVHELSRPRLFLDEWLVWRAARPESDVRGLCARIEAERARIRTFSDEELDAALARPLAAEALLDPARGAEGFAETLELIRRVTGLDLRRNQVETTVRLLSGLCIELRTGEGKTIAAGLAALVAARAGIAVHVVTVNDYLAARDRDLVAPIAERLGLRVSVVLQGQPDAAKRAAYDAQIVYGTNKTFVFDHLRDRREARRDGAAARARQNGHAFAIVDEVDSILIDDATVPMILSEPAERPPKADRVLFQNLVRFAQSLEAGDARVRDRSGNWRLTRSGLRKLEEVVFGWHHPAARRAEIVDLAETALMAVYGFRAGVSYVVEEGEIRMIDPSNGRLMPDRKWEYGMQQMVEIKEGLPLSTENRTVGQITQQTYFRQYKVLSGLTGTGRECRGEFWAIYKLPTSFVAPFAPSRLRDFGFRRFRTAAEKWHEVATRALEVAESRAVLIGLNDVTEAQDLSREFARRGRPVTVLDALSEEREAEIVARGGERGRITIATHLAGRGTDISLAPEVRDAGGLHVIIASVMASGRLERQLYGRAGRQGDPGSFERMISFEDRGIEEGAFSIWRRCVTWMLRRGIFPAFSLAQIQAERDRRARSLRRRTLLREQDLMRRIGYR